MYPDTMNPVTQVDQLFLLIIGISGVILLGITMFMVYCLIAYHHTRNAEPSQVDSHLPLEIAWTIIPTFLVMGMFYFGWAGFRAMRTVPPDAFVVKTTAKMWSWQFEYPNGKISDELWVPQGKPIKVLLNSLDVLHSFYVPGFRIKMDAVPGMETMIWFRPDTLGSYTIYCAEYCGLNHSAMLSQVNVLPVQIFETWYTTKDERSSISVEGKKLLRAQGCLACHSLDGKEMLGPTFKGLFGRQTIVVKDGQELTLREDEEHLKSSITEPALDIVKDFEPVMPKPQNLPEDDIRLMIEFIKTLK